jgi:hypothetical protein
MYFWFDQGKTTISHTAVLGWTFCLAFSGSKWVRSGNRHWMEDDHSYHIKWMKRSIYWFRLIFWCGSHFATIAMKAQHIFYTSEPLHDSKPSCGPHIQSTNIRTPCDLIYFHILTHILPIHNSSSKFTWFLLPTHFIIIIQKPYIWQIRHSPITCTAHKMAAKKKSLQKQVFSNSTLL